MTAIRCTCGKPGHEARMRPQPVRWEANAAEFVRETQRALPAYIAARAGTSLFQQDSAALKAALDDFRRTQT